MTRNFTKLFLTISTLLMVSTAGATNILVQCGSPTICAGNGTDLSLSNNPSTWEVGVNGSLNGTGVGDLFIVALVPTDVIGSFTATMTATNVGILTAVSAVSDGTFSTGELNTVLDTVANGFSNLGNGHPLSSYLTATQLVDPTATAYKVYTYAFGAVSFSSTTNPVITDSAMPAGTVFTSLLTTAGTKSVILSSPNSEGLLVLTAGGTPATSTPEPASLLLIGSAFPGFGLLRRRR